MNDEYHILERLKNLAADIPELIVCGSFQSGAELLNYVQWHPLDAAFLDIQMPEWNGLVLAVDRQHELAYNSVSRFFKLSIVCEQGPFKRIMCQ